MVKAIDINYGNEINSIKQFGFKVSIVIDKNDVIVAGDTRRKANLKLKLFEVPCILLQMT